MDPRLVLHQLASQIINPLLFVNREVIEVIRETFVR